MAVIGLVLSAEWQSFANVFETDWFSSGTEQGDPASDLAYLRQEAEAGNPEAELQLGVRYAKGQGVKLDYGTAAAWFEAAAGHGIPRAQFDMGILYEHGRGVPIDNAKAADWYMKAAEGGFALAEYNLAVFYTRGLGIGQDFTRAAFWYRRAATQGVVQAMMNLAVMYDKGVGIPSSPVDAYIWYLMAAGSGNQAAGQRAAEIATDLSPTNQHRAKLLVHDIATAIIPSPEIPDSSPNTGRGSP